LASPSQFWADLQSPNHQPSTAAASEVSMPVSESEVQPNSREKRASAAQQLLSQSLLDGGLENRMSHPQSPFSIGSDFFTASSPSGFTSVPAFLLCIYAFRKTFLNNASFVGQYKGLLGLHSAPLFVVTLLTIVFFLIPLGIRYLLFYRYFVNKSNDPTIMRPCVRMIPTHSICSFGDPMSDAPPLDWVLLAISFVTSFYFQICTNIIVGTSLYKVS
jgi:hypothetical protein